MRILGLTLIIITYLTSCRETKTESFDLNTLPTDWVQLTDKDGKLIIYNSCDAGNLLLTISKNKDNFDLLLHGQQEDYEFEILESSQQNDTIFINAKWKDSDEKQSFKFFWADKQKGLGRLITTYSSGFTSDNIFVVSEQQTDFEQVDQPCRECWGDECDEIKSTTELMQGHWYHDQDSLSTLIITANNWSFNYQDEQPNLNDNYKISITDKLPEFVKETENAEFLILTNETDTLQYEIFGLTDTTFSLMYFPAGKIHLYRRQR